MQLYYLEAENLYLSNITLLKARLNHANFRGAILRGVNFQESILAGANIHGADLRGASLTAEQLLVAEVDDSTLLDHDLRAEYNRLIAEQ